MTRSVQADFKNAYPLPAGWQERLFQTQDGRRLRYAYVPSVKLPPQGTITLVPGYRDPIDTYGPFVETLQRLGYEVFLMDWFGQGGSRSTHPADAAHAPDGVTQRDVADLEAFHTIAAKARQAQGPHAIIAHSNGGNVLAQFLHKAQRQALYDGAIFLGPLFDINRKALHRTFNLVAQIMHGVGLGDRFIPTPKDEIELFRYLMGIGEKNPNNAHRTHYNRVEDRRPDLWIPLSPTWEWYRNKRKSLDQTRHGHFFKAIETPMLMVVGARDWLIDSAAVRSAARMAPRAKFIKIPGAGHNPLHDSGSAVALLGPLVTFLHSLEKDRPLDPPRQPGLDAFAAPAHPAAIVPAPSVLAA